MSGISWKSRLNNSTRVKYSLTWLILAVVVGNEYTFKSPRECWMVKWSRYRVKTTPWNSQRPVTLNSSWCNGNTPNSSGKDTIWRWSSLFRQQTFFSNNGGEFLELPSAETRLTVQVRSMVAAPVRVMDRRWSKIKCNLVCSVCERVNKNSDTKFAEGCLSIRTSYHVLSLSFILSPLLGIVSSCTVGAGIVECRFGLGNTPRDLLDHAGTIFLISNFNLA